MASRRSTGRGLGRPSAAGWRNSPGAAGPVTWEIDVDTALYRIPNPDGADVVNTIQKMAQKRALVAATLIATSASEFFTQDVEDAYLSNVDTGSHPAGRRKAQEWVRDRKVDELQAKRSEEH